MRVHRTKLKGRKVDLQAAIQRVSLMQQKEESCSWRKLRGRGQGSRRGGIPGHSQVDSEDARKNGVMIEGDNRWVKVLH